MMGLFLYVCFFAFSWTFFFLFALSFLNVSVYFILFYFITKKQYKIGVRNWDDKCVKMISL